MKTLVFDCETTDLIYNALMNDSKQPRIVEMNAQLLEGENLVDELDFLCKPSVGMSDEARHITGITDAMLDGRPPLSEFLAPIEAIWSKADAVVAHNLSFDYRVLNMEFSRYSKSLQWPKRKICTVVETEWIFGRRLKLNELHEHLFSEPISNSHRAKNDVDALRRIYIEMRKMGWL